MSALNVIKQVKKEMDVYDSTDNNFGSVLYVYAPDNELIEEMLPASLSDIDHNAFVSDGFIRIGNPIFSGASFARATEIDRVEGDRVYLTIKQNEVIRE